MNWIKARVTNPSKPILKVIDRPGLNSPNVSPSSLPETPWGKIARDAAEMLHEAESIGSTGASFIVITSPCLYPQFQYMPMCGGTGKGVMY